MLELCILFYVAGWMATGAAMSEKPMGYIVLVFLWPFAIPWLLFQKWRQPKCHECGERYSVLVVDARYYRCPSCNAVLDIHLFD